MKITFSKTREITRAYAADWRIPSSPIVGEICVQYVLVGSGYVMVGSTVCDGGKWECSSSVEGGGRKEGEGAQKKI